MGDEKFKAMADAWLGSACGQVWDDAEAGASLAALLSRVDAEATERAAKMCFDIMKKCDQDSYQERLHGTKRGMLAMLHQTMGASMCEAAIRSTLPTPAARAGEDGVER